MTKNICNTFPVLSLKKWKISLTFMFRVLQNWGIMTHDESWLLVLKTFFFFFIDWKGKSFLGRNGLQELSMRYVKTHQGARRQYSNVWKIFVLAIHEGHIELKFLDKHLSYFLDHWGVKIDKMRTSALARVGQTALAQFSTVHIHTYVFL